MELHLAIVEDRPADAAALADALRTYFTTHHPELAPVLETFATQEAFHTAYVADDYDAIFLDIFLDDGTGMDLARALRGAGDETPLVFITTSPDFAVTSYEVYASGYLLKPVTATSESFQRFMQRFVPRLLAGLSRPAILVATSQYRPVRLPFDSILYIDTSSPHRIGRARNTMLYLKNGQSCSLDLSFAEVRDRVSWDKRFLECTSRLLVNLQYVAALTSDNDFRLKNGQLIPISRRRQKESEAAYFEYLLHKGM